VLRICDFYTKNNGSWIQNGSDTKLHQESIQEQMSTPRTLGQEMRKQLLDARAAVWRAWFAGDRATLEKNFQIALSSRGEDWTLGLQPLASEDKPVYKRIEIRGNGGDIQNVSLERSNGERTLMTLSKPAES